MVVLEVISKSFKEAFWPRRFLPFFLLYLLFFVAVSILFLPMVNFFSSASLELIKHSSLTLNFFSLLAILIIVSLIDLWFTGALIFDVKTKKGFELGLKYSKKVYWQMLTLSLIVFVLFLISSFAGIFGLLIKGIIDWLLIFSLPAIVIKKDNFLVALIRSCSMVRKNVLRSLSFWLLTRIIIFVLLFLFLKPLTLFAAMKILIPESLKERATLSSVPEDYLVLMVAIAASFFIAVSHVFDNTSRAYFFLKLVRRY